MKRKMTKVVWELDVIGDEEKFDTNDEVELAVNQTLAEYLAEAQEVQQYSAFRLSQYAPLSPSGANCRVPCKVETLKDAPTPVVVANQGLKTYLD